MGEVYFENMKSFITYYNNREKIIDKISEVEVKTCNIEDGILSVVKDERQYYLNSRYNSLECARIFAEQYKDTKREAILVVFGFGNGDYIRALVNNTECQFIIVHEPNVEILKKVLEEIDIRDILENDRVFISFGDAKGDMLDEYFKLFLEYTNVRINEVIPLPAYNILYKKEYKEFVEFYMDNVGVTVMNRNTLLNQKDVLIKNLFHTIPDAINQYSINQLYATFKNVDVENVPAILVAAGPSLDKNVHLLKEAKGKAFIMAVDTALKPVLRAGVKPDLTISIDPNKHKVLFEHEDFANIPMIVMPNSNPEIFELHKGKRFYCCNKNDYIKYMCERYGKDISLLSSGGSVANNAFSFLINCGFKNIILMGQDLAYPNNQGHAKDAYDGNEEKKVADNKKYFYVDGVDGNPILTEINMNEYRKWYEVQIVKNPEVNVYDATEGGALINGAKLITFREVIDTLCKKDIDVCKSIDSIERIFTEEEAQMLRNEILAFESKMPEYKSKLNKGIREYRRLLELAKNNKYGTSEYKKLVESTSEINTWINKEPVMTIINNYNYETEYEIQGKVFDYDEDSSQYEQVKEITAYGIKMLESYISAVDKFAKELPELIKNLKK